MYICIYIERDRERDRDRQTTDTHRRQRQKQRQRRRKERERAREREMCPYFRFSVFLYHSQSINQSINNCLLGLSCSFLPRPFFYSSEETRAGKNLRF